MKKLVSFTLLAALICLALASVACAAADVSVSWTEPTKYTDGTNITAPLKYRVAYGTAAGSHPTVIDAGRPASCGAFPPPVAGAKCTQSLSTLPDGTYYVVVTAEDANGNKSANSNEVSRTIFTVKPNAPTNVTIIVTLN
jgi:hypothetical protein